MRGVLSLSAIDSRPTAVVIADQLRERIIDGSFGPGDQINEAQVAHQLNVSRGPVREALQRLVQEGLLIGRPNRGVFVRELTLRDIAEVYEAREVIECAAAESLAARDQGDRNELVARLEEIARRMQEPLDARDWSALSRTDLEFHTALVEAGGNSRLTRAYQTLATEALICLSHFENTYPLPERVLPDHLEIAELVSRGDMEEIHLALHHHLSVENFELHTHPATEALRHGRNESAVPS
ncbi:GntR family transcriptional regulator [Microbacterium sp.]|uniref:GntR family transcriptional regulator n=1 Tax=Microbacterium sp. TaxID=51671 RepID=UPI0039E3F066